MMRQDVGGASPFYRRMEGLLLSFKLPDFVVLSKVYVGPSILRGTLLSFPFSSKHCRSILRLGAG